MEINVQQAADPSRWQVAGTRILPDLRVLELTAKKFRCFSYAAAPVCEPQKKSDSQTSLPNPVVRWKLP